MNELKTKQNSQSVTAFIASIENDNKKKDCATVLKLMKEITGWKPKMWGSSMVGFGSYHYKYNSGHEGDWFITGFSPRKQNFTIYIMPGFSKYEKLMDKLGKYKTGKSCLYLKRLSDIDMKVLKQLIARSVKDMARMYPQN